MYEMPPRRMFIDMWPPPDPEKGDVWIRLGEWRIFEDGGWYPRWEPPEPPDEKMPEGYPRSGWRKGRLRRKKKPTSDSPAEAR